ncbi:site-specific integrase [[Clostridium] hylemonae]|nr:site-specific integrase [[Clostridium] hylemonae]QEK19471.1 Putative prophage phiRv2 integrase [[Clostridium] hylemonae DSM 15053]
MPTYLNQSSQTWYCKFYYKDSLGRIRQKKKGGFRLQRDAREWERSFINQHEGSLDMSFSDLYSAYFESMKHRLRDSTLLTKDNLIKTKILPYFGNIPINQIDPGAIREWQNIMCGQQMNNGKHYSSTYLKAMNNQLSTVFNYAVRYYNLPSNPCLAAGSMGKKQAGQKTFWKPEEFHIFLEYFSENMEMYLIFSLLYYTGVRIGEMLAFSYDDFNLQKGTVTVRKSYRRIRKTDYITPPKTPKSFRVIALPAFLIEQLQKYFSLKEGSGMDERIFSGISRYHISKFMNEACENTKVKKIRIHDLRHSHASLLIELGVSPVLIAERLGHENVETTLNIYSHLYPHRQKELAESLDRLYCTNHTMK